MIRSVTDVATPPTLDALLRLILTSRVYDVARETPLDRAPRLSIASAPPSTGQRGRSPSSSASSCAAPTTRDRATDRTISAGAA